MESKAKILRYRRFKGWDYARGASLFITIATEPRRPVFGDIVDGKVVRSPLGEAVAFQTDASGQKAAMSNLLQKVDI